MRQTQEMNSNLALRFYLFLRNRDAKIVELFFLALNIYILALIILPPYSYTGTPLLARIAFQTIVTSFNLTALLYSDKRIRTVSAIANAAVMGLISAGLISADNPHAGTYVLLTLLAIFVCWKITIK